ncbi:Mrp/NBP35 family ATP-binding protein [Pseudorhodobacter wandonensis]|jgi:ATP-binding protein involved in chromosome partitioning|uniref:Mrp/NBP35 family ATP-binding protein n=1 Tax=Pseudorhodobacter wandonensis TaxID=1120568 RepID=UPI00067BF458|nr:Mrp/NBP35 family ATP-binding protein [Pseudorhodobacter wandonensis]
MALTKDNVMAVLGGVALPDGGTLVSRDLIRALVVEGDSIRFVIEAASPDQARALAPVQAQAEAALRAQPGVSTVQVVMTAHGPAAKPPSLKIGQHPTPQQGGPAPISGIDRIIAIGSGKGGVGKSTVSSNLAVALAKQGRRVGLLDADIYGPSQPRMMGVSKRPASPDGKTIIPLQAHGVTVMSMGLMLHDGDAVVWRGPMIMGALQQLLTQVEWGKLDVLIIDLPPGTGDIQLTLCQRTQLTGAIVVSTPQDVAMLDARRALDMFAKLKTPVLGLIENMSTYHCPNCGHEAHLFGHGGVAAEAAKIGVPFLGELPLELETRVAGDAGTPIALGDGPAATAYAQLAARLVAGGMA